MAHAAKSFLAILLLAVSLAGAQEVDEPGELSSLEEIDRQLNNPLSKTWALTFQYIVRYSLPKAWSVGAGPSITYDWKADEDDRLTVPIGLGVTKTVRIGKVPTKLRAEVHYSVVRPDSYGEVWNIRLQITPVIPSPFIK